MSNKLQGRLSLALQRPADDALWLINCKAGFKLSLALLCGFGVECVDYYNTLQNPQCPIQLTTKLV